MTRHPDVAVPISLLCVAPVAPVGVAAARPLGSGARCSTAWHSKAAFQEPAEGAALGMGSAVNGLSDRHARAFPQERGEGCIGGRSGRARVSASDGCHAHRSESVLCGIRGRSLRFCGRLVGREGRSTLSRGRSGSRQTPLEFPAWRTLRVFGRNVTFKAIARPRSPVAGGIVCRSAAAGRDETGRVTIV